MRFPIAVVVLLAAMSAISPAAAAGLSGMGAAIFGNSAFQFRKANLETVPVEVIKVGSVKLVLQRTRLVDLQKVFGGTVQHQGEGAGRADWLCYTTDGSNGPAANAWFISNALGGHEFVMMVAAELANPKKPSPDCEPAPAKFSLPDFSIPSLGAGVAELKARFGSAPASRGAIAYRADEPGTDALGTALNVQYIGYKISKNQVAGIGIGETSAQMPQ